MKAVESVARLAASFAQREPVRANFRDAVVLITGGSRGLGLALAEEAGHRGATVVICARERTEIDTALLLLIDRGVRATGETCDVGDPADAARVVENVLDRHGRIDVVLNDAGTIIVGPFAEMTRADFDDALRVNFSGALNTMLAALPHMRARRRGHIVNVDSIGGRIGVPHLSAYCAAKFALTGLCNAVRAELRRDGIVLTLVQPGLMRTGSPRNATFKGRHRDEYAWFSIADSLLSMGAAAAARAIWDAAERGVAETTIGLPAELGAFADRLVPRAVRAATALADALLPKRGGIGPDRARGDASTSALSESVLTAPNRKAEEKYGQRI